MHHVGRVEDQPFEEPGALAGHHRGLSRAALVDGRHGAVHTDLGLCALTPGGSVDAHVHSYELMAYVLSGTPALLLDGRPWQLRAGDYALMPIGVAHAWANPADDEARWLTMSTPPRLGPDAGRSDTFPIDPVDWSPQSAGPIDPSRPTSRWLGHYEGTPPQAEALRLADPARGRRPVGADTALLAYSGISVKMLVDRVFGAELLTVFTVDYEPGGSAQIHDHPFEESYFFLDGEIEGEIEGTVYQLRAGDVVWAGVGALHGFFNDGDGRVRWIETQAPQPPARHSYRWADQWKRFGASVEG
jgi:quercetin dioxygenase-like cupin family protein